MCSPRRRADTSTRESSGCGARATASVCVRWHHVCESVDAGVDAVDLGAEMLANTDLTTHQAAVFVVSSADHCCPEYGPLVE
jgi:Protein of unknown function (DUF732)